ncbi:PucR family transcriptional regulator [Microbispora rosea]|uniref:PucR C-terminal helix-turn-helix domain-containing protein n=1 Tax=Microbispora rosea TaxID=58117 RepID=A0A1N6RQX0_9ACTN|nr:helix-turn-helix domain-containing protein [Microbispora rosea]GIH45906.1 PucR family transcriptional regulator [Microbispora rosea subsp. rosea]SIQ31290.1 PucR C-terminal helix-turn-helix domain-containing protein [Microbispora rosea]
MRSRTDAEVRELLRTSAAGLLERLPELADELVKRGRDSDEAYRMTVPFEDHWKSTHEGLRVGITAILQPRHERRDVAYAQTVGRRRAEFGLPLDSLMRSYRLAAQVTWNGVIDIIGDQGQERLPALLRSATHVWHAIDRQAVAAADAYRRRENELLGRTNQRVNAMLDALLEGRADPAVAGVAAGALGLPEHGRYAVVTTRLPAQPDRVHRPDEIGGLRFLWRMRPDLEMAVVYLGDRELDDLVAAITPVVCASAGVSPVVESLADLGTARRLAEVAMRTCSGTAPEIARLDRRLPAALVVCQPELAGHLAGGVLGPIIASPDGGVLLATLEAWLRCEGSAVRAAVELYCHRNTVFNRVRRIEQLTGRSLARPLDVVELSLALDAVRLLPGT